MRNHMKQGGGTFWVLAVLFLVLAGGLVFGADEYTSHRLTTAGLSVTNDQINAKWSLAGLLIHYQTVATQDVQVVRVSGAVSYVLAVVPSGSTNVVWSMQQSVPFKYGDYFTLGSGGGTGSVQVIRQSEAR